MFPLTKECTGVLFPSPVSCWCTFVSNWQLSNSHSGKQLSHHFEEIIHLDKQVFQYSNMHLYNDTFVKDTRITISYIGVILHLF